MTENTEEFDKAEGAPLAEVSEKPRRARRSSAQTEELPVESPSDVGPEPQVSPEEPAQEQTLLVATEQLESPALPAEVESQPEGTQVPDSEPELAGSSDLPVAMEAAKPVRRRKTKSKDLPEPLATENQEPAFAEIVDVSENPETVEHQSQPDPIEPRQKKPSWIRRLLGLIQRPASEPSEEAIDASVEPEAPAYVGILTNEDLSLSPTRLRKEIAAAKRELKATTQQISDVESAVATNLESIETIDEEMQKLNGWQEESSRTFIARIQERMKGEIADARTEMSMHEEAVKNLEPLEPGYLLKLRKAFHKSLTWALISCGGLLTIATIIRFRNELPRLDWLAVLYDPNLSGPILIAAATLIIGVVILVLRRAGKGKVNLRKLLGGLFALLFTSYVIWDASHKTSFIQKYFNPWIDRHYIEIVSWLVSIWALWVVSTLIVYYRNWSIFQRTVDQQLVRLSAVIEGYVKTQQEIQRLELLHKQTNDWMRIIANALFRPWKVNPEWGTTKEFSKHYDTFPFALRVAQALEGNDSRMAELERIIGGHLLKQGWRNKAFEDLVAAVGDELGLPNGKFTVDFLDHDLPHQTNNSRKLLGKFLAHSAHPGTQYGTGSDETSTNKDAARPSERITDAYLVKVAKSRLLTLIEKTQSHAIATARPRVEQIIDDPLIRLRSDESGIDEFDSSESWDDFLTDALGAKTVDQFPLGVLTFSESGRLDNLPSQVRTFIAVPKRLSKALPTLTSEHMEIVPMGDDRPHPVEIIARIDVVGPVEFDDLQLLGTGKDAPASPTTNPKTRLEEETL